MCVEKYWGGEDEDGEECRENKLQFGSGEEMVLYDVVLDDGRGSLDDQEKAGRLGGSGSQLHE